MSLNLVSSLLEYTEVAPKWVQDLKNFECTRYLNIRCNVIPSGSDRNDTDFLER